MDNFGSYDSGNRYENYDRHKKRGGGNVFATIVIIVVVVLIVLLVVGLFWPGALGQEQTASIIVTPTPTATATPEAAQQPAVSEQPEETAALEPTATPAVSEEDRDMPELDGVTPVIPGEIENPIPDIYDAVSPGVVGVINYTKSLIGMNNKETYEVYGSGTGFAVSSEGYILTNAHVVEDADKVTIKIDGDDEEYDAIIIGVDTETDVAVLKVDGVTLHPLDLGDSDEVRVGEFVLAIGNPLSTDELANTLTYGIISAVSREITIDNYTNTYLQTDAAINFGNSGGPLINMQGQVIGINSAKTVTAGYDEYGNAVSAEGIGFALPINQVKKIMELLITEGSIERPGIGITVGTVTEADAEEYGTPVGAYVESVVKGQPAEKAGILAGDIIVEANGETIETQQDLIDIVTGLMIGDELQVKVYRDGEYLDLTIVIGNKTDMDFDDVVE